ncbi:hypothetical protein Daesc_004715 [Daldinia eschscholtzii]|uniref:Probable beta-glucosidase F n=1 Tax=Daldinia eschscholtzii TaxID=292717 RepID=A0AAX6MQG9_9PEZI
MRHPSRVRSLLLCFLASTASASALLPRDPVPEGFVAAPYYPTPYGGWDDDWSESYGKAVKLVSQMTLAEKVNVTAGTGLFMGMIISENHDVVLGILDGPLGVRSTDNVTAFPAGITTGATFNKDLIYERGAAIGEEFKGKGANFYLGPCVGPLGRKPRGGRNWEGFGTDPVLQAIAGVQTIKGVQDRGVIAVLKHLLGNEQELYRMYNPLQQAYSSNLGKSTRQTIIGICN